MSFRSWRDGTRKARLSKGACLRNSGLSSKTFWYPAILTKNFIKATEKKNVLWRFCIASDIATKIQGFHALVSHCLQHLGLGLSQENNNILEALAKDQKEAPMYLERILKKNQQKVDNQHLETIAAIKKFQESQEALAASQVDKMKQMMTDLKVVRAQLQSRSSRHLMVQTRFSIAAEDVQIFYDEQIGSGSFSQVYKGMWEKHLVAIKQVKFVISQRTVDDIQREVSLWHSLNHPNVVLFYRACLNADKPFIVMELMQSDLFTFLNANKKSLTFATRFKMVQEIAQGLNYLHSFDPPISHGDFKTNNVMLDFHGIMKITDFGLATAKIESASQAASKVGAVRWKAPELYKRGKRDDRAADVFAFAMTAYHVFVGEIPFIDKDDDQVKDILKSGERPCRSDAVPLQVWDLLDGCWEHDPAKRFTISQTVAQLELICSELGIQVHAPSAIQMVKRGGTEMYDDSQETAINSIASATRSITLTENSAVSNNTASFCTLKHEYPQNRSPLI